MAETVIYAETLPLSDGQALPLPGRNRGPLSTGMSNQSMTKHTVRTLAFRFAARPVRRQPLLPRKTVAMIALVCVGLIGCREQESVRRFSVPKPPAPAATDGMLVAWAESSARVWFFKMTGAASQVESQREAFLQLIRSLQFGEEETPRWELPAGWAQLPSSGMRFATLRTGPDDGSLEVSVISLPAPQELLPNVNRWRQQLQMPPAGADEFAESVQRLSVDGRSIQIVELAGRLDPAAQVPPMMAESRPASPSRPTELKFDVPEQWTQLPAAAMQTAAFSISDGDATANVSVTRLGGTGGGPLMNINRWRGQIGLPPVGELTELGDSVSSVKIANSAVQLVRLVGDEQAITAAIIPQPTETWFVKLMGDPALVAQEDNRLQQFLSGVRFE